MTNCKSVHENLFTFLDKELPSTLMQELDKHVEECAGCARLLSEFRSVMVLIEDQKSIEPRPFAETRILQGIESRLEKRQKSASPVFTRILQPVLISAGVLTALAIGYIIGSDVAGTHSPYSENIEMTETVRSDLNVPEFMADDIIYFTE